MIKRIRSYLQHQLRAVNRHGVHSPFAFEFITQVLPHKPTAFGEAAEQWRMSCLENNTLIQVEDFGAGYGGKQERFVEKSIAAITKSSARPRREGELLSRICKHYDRKNVLELGTNLGFSAAYLANGVGDKGQVQTIEGALNIAAFSEETFSKLKVQVKSLTGEFGKVFPKLDWDNYKPDLVLIDGNHTKEATIQYFEYLLPKLEPSAILIFDDIHWSEGMEQAWAHIIADPKVRLSIDLYAMGIVFLDRNQAKQHFQFRFRTW